MKQAVLSLSALLILSALILPASAADAPAGVFLAGAAEADITPVVAEYDDRNGNGRFDYGDPTRAYGYGDRVTRFADGEILVGNGNGSALYIYDPVYARALVLEDPSTGKRVALVSLNLYLLTGPDADAIRTMVDPALGLDAIIIASDHTHMSPDTLGLSGLNDAGLGGLAKILLWKGKAPSGINGPWFEGMLRTVADLIEEAAGNLKEAKLTFASRPFGFGAHDEREPHIFDNEMVVMGVDDLEGRAIATLVQWACHPESVLYYGAAQGRDLGELDADTLAGFGRTISAGFVGSCCAEIKARRGGVPLYFNGALGGMITNLDAILWDPEAHPEYPVGTDPEQVPASIRIPNDYRFAPIQGRELAKAALEALDRDGETAQSTSIQYASREVLIPFENKALRLMSSLGIVGLNQGALYGKSGNVDSRRAPWIGGLFLPAVGVAKGKNLRTEVAVATIGPAQIACIPAELLGELSAGLPEDFDANVGRYFPENADAHPTGPDYALAYPPLKSSMTSKYKFIFCLCGDELGYVIPKSDFRPPHDLKVPPFLWWWICNDPSTDPHYEESMTVGSRIEPRLMGALTELLNP